MNNLHIYLFCWPDRDLWIAEGIFEKPWTDVIHSKPQGGVKDE